MTLKKYSLLIKIIAVYILANIFIFLPVNKHIISNINNSTTIFQNQNRLFYYDKSPDLSMAGHWINKYHQDNKYNILMVGDSTVEDFYVDYPDSIAHLLDKHLFGEKDRPYVFNFGSSGTKSVYVFERIKKAAEYNPDLIIWQMGAGSYPDVNWVFPYSESSYQLSLGGGILGAYSNILKINDQNAPFISQELRGNVVPLYRYQPFFKEYKRVFDAQREGRPLRYPNQWHMNIQIGDRKITEEFESLPFVEDNKNFEVIGFITRYLYEKNIPLMIYIAPINQDIRDQKYALGYYDELLRVVERETSPYNVPILDLNNAIPPRLFIDGGHLKEEGDRIVAARLNEFIRRQFNFEVVE